MSINMNNAEFDSVRGVCAVVASIRAKHLLSAAKRDFVMYLQGRSLREGGFRRMAREVVKMFPERLGTPDMRDAGVVAGKTYPADLKDAVEIHLGIKSPYDYLDGDAPREGSSPCDCESLRDLCRRAAFGQNQTRSGCKPSENDSQGRKRFERLPLENFLVELCTNPKLNFDLPGVDGFVEEYETERAMEADSELVRDDFQIARLIYFQDIIGALVEYRRRQEQEVRDGFYITAIGKTIWEHLDFALSSKSMVMLDGLPGRGKSAAVKAWCALNLGRARFVSLKGIANKTAMFRAIASALGVTYAYGRSAMEMQAKIEDVLNRSKMMLVIDEAHFAFSQSRQMKTPPELIDWIDTALCNEDKPGAGSVPVALITTPQFMECLARAKNQVGWNYIQFQRRVRRIKLPPKNSRAEIFAVTRSVFRNTSEAVIEKIVGYVILHKLDLSGVGSMAKECRVILNQEAETQLDSVPLECVEKAGEFLLSIDRAFMVDLAAAESKLPKKRKEPKGAKPPADEDERMEESEPDPKPTAAPADESPAIPAADRVRGHRQRASATQSAVAAAVVPPRGDDTEAVLTAN